MSKAKSTQYTDIIIVGGGMIGSCLALALARLPFSVTLIEPFAPTDDDAPGFDARAIALSRASAKILDSLGIWQPLKSDVTLITDIHVSDKGRAGICRLSAREVNIPAMGYVVELSKSGRVLNDALEQANIRVCCPARVTALQKIDTGWDVAIAHEDSVEQLSCALVIAADGGNSSIRELLGIQSVDKSYRQDAIISTIQSQLPHNHQAFERFTDDGPVALLPLSDNRISLVWMLPPNVAQQKVDCDEYEFLAALQEAFGYRLGTLTRVGKRYRYPLQLRQTKSSVQGVIFVGNAAQSLHPIAGQGFNLGLRDVADLVDVLRKAEPHKQDISDPAIIGKIQSEYVSLRERDKELIVTMTDSLARLFANPSPLLSIPRNLLLNLLALNPTIRHEFGRFAMGLNHPAARLTRGLDIEVEQS